MAKMSPLQLPFTYHRLGVIVGAGIICGFRDLAVGRPIIGGADAGTRGAVVPLGRVVRVGIVRLPVPVVVLVPVPVLVLVPVPVLVLCPKCNLPLSGIIGPLQIATLALNRCFYGNAVPIA